MTKDELKELLEDLEGKRALRDALASVNVNGLSLNDKIELQLKFTLAESLFSKAFARYNRALSEVVDKEG